MIHGQRKNVSYDRTCRMFYIEIIYGYIIIIIKVFTHKYIDIKPGSFVRGGYETRKGIF